MNVMLSPQAQIDHGLYGMNFLHLADADRDSDRNFIRFRGGIADLSESHYRSLHREAANVRGPRQRAAAAPEGVLGGSAGGVAPGLTSSVGASQAIEPCMKFWTKDDLYAGNKSSKSERMHRMSRSRTRTSRCELEIDIYSCHVLNLDEVVVERVSLLFLYGARQHLCWL